MPLIRGSGGGLTIKAAMIQENNDFEYPERRTAGEGNLRPLLWNGAVSDICIYH